MSSFTFYNNIPQPGDNPSNSQAQFLQNFTAIGGTNSWTTQDHFGFGTGTDGQHKQITFASNNTPTSPTSPPILFTKLDSFSIPQLFYYTGTAAQSANQYSIAQGSTMLLGGIILKWGFGPTGALAVAYSVAFPHATLNVQITAYADGRQYNVTGGFTANGFTYNTNPTGGTQFYWTAIGY